MLKQKINQATIAMILHVLVSLAPIPAIHPYLLTIGTTVAASCAFMLQVATSPNAVIFGSGLLKIEDMMMKRIWMNIISIVILTGCVYLILPMVWQLNSRL